MITLPPIFLNDLCGLPFQGRALPKSGRKVRSRLNNSPIELFRVPSNGGSALAVLFEDLPPDTQTAYLQRLHGVAPEDGPDAALWAAYAGKAPKIRKAAERNLAAMLSFHDKLDAGLRVNRAVAETCKETGVSVASIHRLRLRVKDVPRADWLPVLAANYCPPPREKAPMSEEAWSFFLSFLQHSAPRMPLSTAHRETETAAKNEGWEWPAYLVVWRRWDALPAGEKALIRNGAKALDKTIPPMTRSVAHLQAMQIVNLDGRQADFFVRWEDGTVSRPIVIAIQDVYSRAFLGWRFSKTEDSDTTKTVILDVIDRYGLFDELRTDNGRAFASKKISGGAKHRFRGKAESHEDLGILKLIGAKVGFAKPRRGQSKPIERGFRDIAEQVDTGPEFKGAYCGHRPDAKPEDYDSTAVDISVARAVYDQALRAHNDRPGRRTEMGKGVYSLTQVFENSYRTRPRRDLTAAQRQYFMFDMAYLKPNKDTGALSKDGFKWWSPDHQDALLKYRNTKVCVLFDPTDRSKPVTVHDADGHLIVASLPCLKKGRFDSTQDARQHERGKAQVKAAARKGLKGHNLMAKAQMENIRKRYAKDEAPPPPPTDTTVSKPLFGVPGVKAATTTTGAAPVKPFYSREEQEEFDAAIQRGLVKRYGHWRAG